MQALAVQNSTFGAAEVRDVVLGLGHILVTLAALALHIIQGLQISFIHHFE